jgi:hypothetical protein
LSLRSDDLDSVGELYPEDDFRQLVVTVETAPAFLGAMGPTGINLANILRGQKVAVRVVSRSAANLQRAFVADARRPSAPTASDADGRKRNRLAWIAQSFRTLRTEYSCLANDCPSCPIGLTVVLRQSPT